ncbi:hypothetical protein GvMRE_IIg372 [endosymbiont GvMRE of Glomus versiforme]|nr:hypothetical protein GvMRE_IIg372 [endosymbiont GvMRE of Glomus versiforme]
MNKKEYRVICKKPKKLVKEIIYLLSNGKWYTILDMLNIQCEQSSLALDNDSEQNPHSFLEKEWKKKILNVLIKNVRIVRNID